jgi:exosortase D (VPLPA-CTERM-specific)
VEIILVAATLTLAVIAVFGPALLEAAKRWSDQEEYSHGFLVPIVSAWLLWTRRAALAANVARPSWIGLVAVMLATLLHVVGKLSALFIFSQVGMILALLGIVLCIGGIPLLRVAFIPLAFLAFAIPLPYFLDSVLSWRLQILSSELGVVFIRALQIPVFLDGNVIDLGHYKLQVVEACSGLRYLYPLLSLAFLVAWLFRAPLWHRAAVFLSAIPITITMNSARLALIAVLVDRWGISQAEGLLHLFEGWVIFLACAGLLIAEAYLLARLGSRRPLRPVFGLTPAETHATQEDAAAKLPYMLACLLLLCIAGLSGTAVSDRHEIIPERASFVTFPATLGAWQGHASSLEPQVEQFLGPTDYIISDYSRPDGRGVNLYVAYYASQRDGLSPHSPQMCIPGNGWQITQIERTSYRDPDSDTTLWLNRAVIERDSDRQVVYYWFDERGRRVTNEYMLKWYLLKDAIHLNRTDGALVRLTTALYPGEDEKEADLRLQAFTRDLLPNLAQFLPRAPAQVTNIAGAVTQQK